MRTFEDRVVSEIVKIDERGRRTKHWNHYFVGIALTAVRDVMVPMLEGGSSEAEAFAETFTPTRETFRAARNLGLPLDVERGNWVSV